MMKNKIYFPIHNKITLLFVLIIAVLLFGSFLYVNKSFQEYTYQNIRADLMRKVSLARSFLEHIPDGVNLNKTADQIARDLDLRVTIISEDGTVVGDSDFAEGFLEKMENHYYRKEVQQALQEPFGESRRFSTSVKEDFLYMATRYQKNGHSGFVRLALPLEAHALVSGKVNKILGVSFVFAFVLSVVAAYIASVFISRPIKRITRGARLIAEGNFDNRIFVSGRDEIAVLAQAFNEMAEQIREKVGDVEMARSQLEAVFLSMVEGVLVIDEQGRIFLMNNALRSLLGVSADPVGKRPLEVIRNADIQEMIGETQNRTGAVLSRDIVLDVPQQRMMHVQSALIHRDDSVAGVVLVFHDITELRRLEDIRKEFVANVSHELRTPVASIKGYAETLLDGALHDQENAEDFVGIILSEAQRLAKLIEDLLDLSSIESGKMVKNISQCSLRPVVNRVLESVQIQAKARDVHIHVSGLDDSIVIPGDEMGLYRMLLNLIENAVKYNKDHGRVDIEIKPLARNIAIDIKDTGMGIPDHDLPRIFERFYRVDKAHSRDLGGTGLGLAIVKHIVQAHHGTISVKSVLGEGSLFTVTLPRYS